MPTSASLNGPASRQACAAAAALAALTGMGLFIGQSNAFFAYMRHLAVEADAAKRGHWDD